MTPADARNLLRGGKSRLITLLRGLYRGSGEDGIAELRYEGTLRVVPETTQDLIAGVRGDHRLRDAEAFWQATLDSLLAHIAILDEHGTIIAVNAAWRRFADSEGGDSDCIGSNYMSVCDAASEPIATVVGSGLRAMLAGEPV
jgi:PAS domain-containing protein